MKLNKKPSTFTNSLANKKPVATGKKPGKPFKPSSRGTKPGKPGIKPPAKDSLALSSEAKKPVQSRASGASGTSVVDNFMNAWMDEDVAKLKAQDAAKR